MASSVCTIARQIGPVHIHSGTFFVAKGERNRGNDLPVARPIIMQREGRRQAKNAVFHLRNRKKEDISVTSGRKCIVPNKRPKRGLLFSKLQSVMTFGVNHVWL